jgi:sugar lactone lactonase YvrE
MPRVASFLVLALPWIAASPVVAQAGLDPNDFPEMASLVKQVGDVYALRPSDPSVLYQVAGVYARAGRNAEALAILRRMAALRSGVDPRLRDGFQGLAGNPEFEEITARIRRENPPVNTARLAFDIAEGSLVPEGIAWSARTRKLYLGTRHRIVSTTLDGQVSDFVSGTPGLGAVAGMRVDDERGELWATSGWFGGPRPAGLVEGLFRFRLSDGALIASYPMPTSEGEILNDVAVAPDGTAYVTESSSGGLSRVAPGGKVDRFLPAGALPDPNGIAASADGRYLFVAGWYGITRVERATGKAIVLGQPPDVASGCLDGLYLFGERDIVAVQNCVHSSGRVMHYALNAARDSITSARVLESYNPLFESITTAAVVGDSLYFVANVQFRKVGRDGKPTAPFDPLHVLVLPLPPRTTGR